MPRPISLKFKNENGFDTSKYRVDALLVTLPLVPVPDVVVDNTTLHTMGSISTEAMQFRVVIQAFEEGTNRQSQTSTVVIRLSDYLVNNTVRIWVTDVETFLGLNISDPSSIADKEVELLDPMVKTIIISGLLP